MTTSTLQRFDQGTRIPNKLTNKWNSGLLHAFLGPVALLSVLVRGTASSIILICQPKNSSLIGKRISWRNNTGEISKKINSNLNTMIIAKIINKLHLLLSSAIGTAAWAALAYLIVPLIQGGTSVAFCKMIAAVAIALVPFPAFPVIFVSICILIALANHDVSRRRFDPAPPVSYPAPPVSYLAPPNNQEASLSKLLSSREGEKYIRSPHPSERSLKAD